MHACSLRGHSSFSRLWQRTLLATTCLGVAGTFAYGGTLPTGLSCSTGSCTTTTAGNTQTITAPAAKTIGNFTTFSIGPSNTVNIVQGGPSSIFLARVSGGQSQINGTLTDNGQLWLINPSGVLFGAGATVNVFGLLATTADISNANFLAGNYDFSKSPSNPASVIQNDAAPTVANPNRGIHTNGPGGYVALAGARVVNNGLIQADFGVVQLAAGKTFAVDFNGDGMLQFQVTAALDTQPTAGSSLISNAGALKAEGGTVLMTSRAASNIVNDVINTSGIVEANSAKKLSNGDIVLGEIDIDAGANGSVVAHGTVDASSVISGVGGGKVALAAGQNITVGATVNVDGNNANGGTVFMGGDTHGAAPLPLTAPSTTTPTAATTTLEAGGKITADATGSGNGGTVAVWSTGTTATNGSVSVAGAGGGTGGLVALGAGTSPPSGGVQKLAVAGPINAPGGTVTLNSTGGIGQGTAGITAALLTGSSANGVTLNSAANAVTALGPFTNAAGNFTFANTLTLRTAGAVSSAGNLTLVGPAGVVTLGGVLSGQTVTIRSLAGAGISLGTNVAGTLNIADATLGEITTPHFGVRTTGAADDITINAITAHPSLGDVTVIPTHGVVFGSGGASFAGALTVRAAVNLSVVSPDAVTLSGPITAAGDIAIASDSGDLTLTNALTSTGGNVLLEATHGSINGAGTITAGGGNLSLIAANSVGSVLQPLEVADSATQLVIAGSAGNGDFILSGNAPLGMVVGTQIPPGFGFTTLAAPGVTATGTVGIQNRTGNLLLADNVTAGGPNVFLEADGGGGIANAGGDIVFGSPGGHLSLVADAGIGTGAQPLVVSSASSVTFASLVTGGGAAHVAGPVVAGPQAAPVPTGFTVILPPTPVPPIITPPPPPPGGPPPSGPPTPTTPTDTTGLADQLNLIQPAAGGESDEAVDCVATALQYAPPQAAEAPGGSAVIAGLLFEQQPQNGCAVTKKSGNAPAQDFFSGWGRQSLW